MKEKDWRRKVNKYLLKRTAKDFLKHYGNRQGYNVFTLDEITFHLEDAREMSKLQGLVWNEIDLLSSNKHIRQYAEEFFGKNYNLDEELSNIMIKLGDDTIDYILEKE